MSRSPDASGRRVARIWLRLLGIAGALVVVLLPAAPAAAHAVLVESQPANGAAVTRAPRTVLLRFSEDISPRFSSVSLTDGSGRTVGGTRITTDRHDARVLTLSLPELRDATYGVAWRVFAEDDGHATGGVVVFTVGNAPQTPGGQAIQTLGTVAGGTPPHVARRSLGLCLLAGLIGGLAFALVVLRPRAADPDDPVRAAVERVRRRVLGFAAIAGVLAAGVGLADPAAQAQQAGARGSAAFLSLLADTRWGQLWALREAMVIALAVLAVRLRSAARTIDTHDRVRVAALVVTAVSAEALAGHAASAGSPRAAAVAVVAAHALAAFVWLGGVASLPLVMFAPGMTPDGRAAVRGLVRDRFAVLAGGALGLVVATGLYSAGRQVGSWRDLVDTSYGRTLLVKTAVLLVIGTLGMISAGRLRGAFRGRPVPPLSRRLLVAEAAAGAVVLLAAGLLVETPPPGPPPAPAGAAAATSRAGTAEDVVVSVSITPNRPGANAFTVLAVSRRRPPPAPIDEVSLLLDGGSRAVALHEIEPGRYVGTADLPSPGTVRAVAGVRRGARHLTVPIEWVVPAAVLAAPAPRRDGLAVVADVLAAALLGVLGVAAWRVIAKRRRRILAPPAEAPHRVPEGAR